MKRVTQVKTRTARVITKTVTVTANKKHKRASEYERAIPVVEKRGEQEPAAEAAVIEDDAEVEETIVDPFRAESSLFKRHLCVICPLGVTEASGKNNWGSKPRGCCPRRKTTTKTRVRTFTKIKPVTKTNTIYTTVTPKISVTMSGIM